MPDVCLPHLGGGRPAPLQGHTPGCPLCSQVYVMVVVDISPFVDTAERAVKMGIPDAATPCPCCLGFRGIGFAVLVKQFDVVELTHEVVPQPPPVVDSKVFGVFRRRADLDVNDGIFGLFGLLQCQPHEIPYTRGIQTGRQQIVLDDMEDKLGMFLVSRFSRDILNVIYPVGEEIDSAFPIMVPSPDLLYSLSR